MFARPFENTTNNRLEYVSIVVPLIILYSGLLFYSEKIDTTTERVVTGLVIALFCIAVILIATAVYHHLILLYGRIKKKVCSTLNSI